MRKLGEDHGSRFGRFGETLRGRRPCGARAFLTQLVLQQTELTEPTPSPVVSLACPSVSSVSALNEPISGLDPRTVVESCLLTCALPYSKRAIFCCVFRRTRQVPVISTN